MEFRLLDFTYNPDLYVPNAQNFGQGFDPKQVKFLKHYYNALNLSKSSTFTKTGDSYSGGMKNGLNGTDNFSVTFSLITKNIINIFS